MSSGILASGTIGSQFYSKTASLNLPSPLNSANTITARTLPSSAGYQSVAYGNGTYVAIGGGISTSREVATSTDGITWVQRSNALPTSTYWSSVAYGNGLFVAVAGWSTAVGGSYAATSPDGITWTSRTLPTTTYYWSSVTYGNGLFVAVAGSSFSSQNTNIAATSPDGITWTQRTLPANVCWNSVTYGNGIFVAVASGLSGGNGSIVAASSIDGITWTQRTIPANNYSSVAYGNGVFVAVAGGNWSGSISPTNYLAVSTDGVNWIQKTMPISGYSQVWRSVSYGNGVFIAIPGGNGTSNAAISYDNGNSWSQLALTTSAVWTSIAYGGSSGFIAVNNNNSTVGNYIYNPVKSVQVSYTNNHFSAIVGHETVANTLVTSTDSITWTRKTLPVAAQWSTIGYGNGTYIALSSTNGATSTDLVTWTQFTPPSGYWSKVIYGNGIFVAINSTSSDKVMYSDNGTTWTVATVSGAPTSSNPYISDICYGQGKFLICYSFLSSDSRPYVFSSINGASWSAVSVSAATTALTNSVKSFISYYNGLFIHEQYISADGLTWTDKSSVMLSGQTTYAGGTYLTINAAGAASSSPDCATWTGQGTLAVTTPTSTAVSDTLFVTTGYSNQSVIYSVYTDATIYTVPAGKVTTGKLHVSFTLFPDFSTATTANVTGVNANILINGLMYKLGYSSYYANNASSGGNAPLASPSNMTINSMAFPIVLGSGQSLTLNTTTPTLQVKYMLTGFEE